MSHSLLSLGTINKNIKYPILLGVTHSFIRISFALMRGKDAANCALIQNCIMYLGEFLIIFLYLIETKRSNAKFHQITDLSIKKILKIVGLIFLTCLIDFVGSISLTIVETYKGTEFLELIYKLFTMGLTAVLSRYLLHYQYYIHHIIGYGILLVGLACYSFLEIIGNFKESEESQESQESQEIGILGIFVLFIIYLLSSFIDIIEKYLMEAEYVSPFLIISTEGAFGLILSFISFQFLNDTCTKTFFICETPISYWNNFKKFFEDSNLIIALILFFIGVFCVNTFKMLTNQRYSPTHRAIGDNLSAFIFWIIQFFEFKKQEELWKTILKGVTYVIMFLGIFIFLELIIINVFDLNRNTRDSINTRVDEEEKEIEYINDNNINLINQEVIHNKEETE